MTDVSRGQLSTLIFTRATLCMGQSLLSVRHTPVLCLNGQTYLNFFDHLVASS